MPAKRSPEQRASVTDVTARSVRRRFKTNLSTRKRILPGEKEGIAETVAVLKIAGYSNVQIGATVGISRGQVKEFLDMPQVAELIVLLRKNLSQAAIDLLQSYTIEAVEALVLVMRTAHDDKTIILAAAEILDRAGIGKVSKSERKVESEHKTTFTDDGIVEQLRELPPERQEEAAQMIEKFEQFLVDHSNNNKKAE